nr:sugar kinase [Microbacterium barkeri]
MTGGRVVTLGETMALVRADETGSLRHVRDMSLGIGGAESNVAVGLSRLGVDVSWLGRVGDDTLGERVVRELRAEGIDVRAIRDTDAPTGLMLKERPRASSTAVHYYRSGSAGSRLSSADLPAGWVEEAALLHVTGITALLSDSAHAALVSAVERAKAAGVVVSFDVNYRSALASRTTAGPLLRDIAARADIVFGGAEELSILFPGRSPERAAALLREDGSGATVFDETGTAVGAGFRVDVVDTVGAGDAFVAGYLSAMLEHLSAEETLRRANACGAVACLAPGDWEAAPTLRELERFLDGDADPVMR